MTEEDKNAETYQLDDLNKKDEETNEDTPLKPKDNDVEAGDAAMDITETKDNEKSVMATGDFEKDDKSSNTLLDNPKVKLLLVIIGAVLLVLLLLIVAIIAVISKDGHWDEDKTYRYIRIIPKPNGPQNLITFRHGHLPYEGKGWPELVQQLQEFINGYNPENIMRDKNVSECFEGAKRPPDNMVCLFDIRTIDQECLKDDFGYASGSPCIFIQFNNISDWRPEPFSDADFATDPELPEALKNIKQNLVYLECKGNSVVDNENMGFIEYTPTQGFMTQYFPYKGHPHYMPPFVAIRFKSPATSIAIGITCKLYAKNLITNDTNSEPSSVLPFNLLIE